MAMFDFGIVEKTYEGGKASFLSFCQQCGWIHVLGQIIISLKNKGYNITDIIITENSAIYSKQEQLINAGILKNVFPLKYFITKEELKEFVDKAKEEGLLPRDFDERFVVPHTDELLTILKKFTGREIETDKDKIYNFSFSIYGLGSFRCMLSFTRGKIMLSIRVLPFILPQLVPSSKFDRNNKVDVVTPEPHITFLDSFFNTEELHIKDKAIKVSSIPTGGLIVHAGATGSGKTTFIAATLEYLSRKTNGLIATYEDPVEYVFLTNPRVIQHAIGKDVKREEIFAHFLRITPTIGFYHECKTPEEFELVIDLASRGHLILTTIHASNVYEVLNLFTTLRDDVKKVFLSVIRSIVVHRLVIDDDGTLVPYYEIFYANQSSKPLLQMIMQPDKFNTVFNMLYKENAYQKTIIKFTDTLEQWRMLGFISPKTEQREKETLARLYGA
jgi:Tfp pilus assembly pilus retraction ATPase PilT